MTKDILLISSPQEDHIFPRGLMQIACFLQESGCSVSVLPSSHALGYKRTWTDSDLKDILESAIRESEPRVVGVSNLFTVNHPQCLRILEICKNYDKKLVTVIGGPHVTFLDRVCLQQSPFVDVVVRGEGEWTMLALMSALKDGRDLGSVKGITFRHNGRIIRSPDRPLGNLNTLPPIDFGMLPSRFVKEARIFGISNRGCRYRCSYCVESIFWGKKRDFPVEWLLHEIMTLEKDYGVHPEGFLESMIDTESNQFFRLTTELIKHKVSLPPNFYIQVRPDCITEPVIDAIKKVGISNVHLGIESGSPTVRKRMGRLMSNKTMTEACAKLRRKNIYPHTYWIIGHPGDNPQEAEVSLTYLDYLYKNDITRSSDCMVFLPYPGTRFFKEPEKYGVEITSLEWAKWGRCPEMPPSHLTTFAAEDIMSFFNRYRQRARVWFVVNHFA